MQRKWNWPLWAGFAVAVLAAFSYLPVFSRFPVTRDVPWVNLVLFLAAGYLLVKGWRRALAVPTRYRGKLAGPILALLSLAICVLFCVGTFLAARSLPASRGVLHAGRPAPEFTLTAADGSAVSLSQLRQGKRAVLLIFYRGYW
jgi:hypothetical protein